MEIASYTHWFYKQTAFSQIQKEDGWSTLAWKIPTGRLLSIAVIITGLTETFFSTCAMIAFYFIDNDRFNMTAKEAGDSIKTTALAAQHFLGLNTIDKTLPKKKPTPPKLIPELPVKPTTAWEKSLQFMKNRVSNIAYLALKYPNESLMLGGMLPVSLATAYYFDLIQKLLISFLDL